jgi:hypothetical protein
MASVGVSNRVIARNGIGQFRSECSLAAERTVEKAVERGARLSRDFAPSGSKNDPRTTKLKKSIEPRMLGRTQGEWTATARHALAIEKGAVPHEITGWVNFFWERESRDWEPGMNLINHPGNAAQPYLRPAYAIVMGEVMAIARGEYPG